MAVTFDRPKQRFQTAAGAVSAGATAATEKYLGRQKEKKAGERAESAEERKKTAEERAATTAAEKTEAHVSAEAGKKATAEQQATAAAEETTAAADVSTAAKISATGERQRQAFMKQDRANLPQKQAIEKSGMAAMQASQQQQDQLRALLSGGTQPGQPIADLTPYYVELGKRMQQKNGKGAAHVLQAIGIETGGLEADVILKALIVQKHPVTGEDIWVPITEDDEMIPATEDEDEDFDYFYIKPEAVAQAAAATGVPETPEMMTLKPGESVVSATLAGGVQELPGQEARPKWTQKEKTSFVFRATGMKGYEKNMNTIGNVEASWVDSRMDTHYKDMELSQAYLNAFQDWKHQKKIDAYKGRWKEVPSIEALKFLEMNPKTKKDFKETYGQLPRGY